MLQRRTVVAPATATPEAPPIVHDVLRTPGRPLDPATRSFFEPRFQHDFSQVRVHDDSRAAESARAVQARAYTVGRHVVFNEGEFRPDSTEGRRTLAHELTHVVQQPAGSALQPSLIVGAQESAPEREAEQAASAIVAGGKASVVQRAPAGTLGRQSCNDLITAQERARVSGTEVDTKVKAQFREQFKDEAVGLEIPGGKNVSTDKSGGKPGEIKPEVFDPLKPKNRAGGGRPDLAYKQGGLTTPSAVELAEVKPADLLSEADQQVRRYVEQGNRNESWDPTIIEYRKKKNITQFEIMKSSRFTPNSPLMIGKEPVTVKWCGPGVIGYKAIRDQDPEVFLCEALSDKGRVDRFLDQALGRGQQQIDAYINSVLDPLLTKAIDGLTLRKAVNWLYQASKAKVLANAGLSADALKGLDDEAIVDKIAASLDGQLKGVALVELKSILMGLKAEFLNRLRKKLQEMLRNALQEGLNALCATATVLTVEMLMKWLKENFKKFLDLAVPEVIQGLVTDMLIEFAKGAAIGLLAAVALVALVYLIAEVGIVAAVLTLARAIGAVIDKAVPILIRMVPRLVLAEASDQSVQPGQGSDIAATDATAPPPAPSAEPTPETPSAALA